MDEKIENIKFSFPEEVGTNYEGYKTFIDLCHVLKGQSLKTFEVNFANTKRFDANLVAILGALATMASNKLNILHFVNIKNDLIDLFQQNGFIDLFRDKRKINKEQSVVFEKFKIKDNRAFVDYIDNELLSKAVLPKMSKLLKKEINTSIYEIFTNAVIHGRCRYVFCCGQHYPKRKRLDFTLVDVGTTIKHNVNYFLKETYNGSRAIGWAIQTGHTTKHENIPGGLGLSLILEFLEKNGGKMQIISADGFWSKEKENIFAKDFDKDFGGTIVNIEFNLDDPARYCLTSELTNLDNIF